MRISISLSEGNYQRLKEYAAGTGQSVSGLLVSATLEHINQQQLAANMPELLRLAKEQAEDVK